MLKALIFDVDGTLADTEEAHRAAFNAAFADAGLAWHWSVPTYARLLDIAGGRERIRGFWQAADPSAAGAPGAAAVVDALHARKTLHYARLAASGQLALRPGIRRLVREARAARLPLAIASTTTPANIDALLRPPFGRGWRALFAAVCDAGTAHAKKPAPDVYLAALAALGLPGADCLAIEDSANGLHAAHAAGIPAIVTPTAWTRGQDFTGALQCLDHLGDPAHTIDTPGTARRWVDLAALQRWHAAAQPEELT